MHQVEVVLGYNQGEQSPLIINIYVMCWYPIQLGMRVTKDGVIIPPDLVPCGKCLECLQAKRAQWSFRLWAELQEAKSATFLTLTYNDLKLPENGSLQKKELQDYFKRVRSQTPGLKYYAVGEYGSKTSRAHYHGIIFNSDNTVLSDKWCRDGSAIGIVSTDYVTPASIHYVTGYVLKKYGEADRKTGVVPGWMDKKRQQPFSLISKEWAFLM